ncbi:MAG: ATP-dependent helicase HrpB [Phycisphaerae bacterium]|nr:ATP-dependent helicase HrpB [Phycisphaerae bacterium]
MQPLPIDPYLAEIIAVLRSHGALVLVAEPGAGKTTRVPPAIIQAGLLPAGSAKLVLLQPRRVAARAIAGRIAQENQWQVGQQVGYQMRLESNLRPHTPLRVLTEGVLTRQLLDNPFLDGIGLVVLDEFHQRSVHADLALAMLRQIQQTVRPDLRIVVMSATMAVEPVAAFLGNCPIMHIPGRTFPVKISHQPPGDVPLEAHLVNVIEQTLERGVAPPAASGSEAPEDPGDILVFLPGVGEIQRCKTALAPAAKRWNLLLLALHGSMSMDEQVRVLQRADRRKVILATNIAETSLTIDGVRTVVDSGLMRQAGYDAHRGMDRLETMRISAASAQQRAGRAGRTAAGNCVRLWSLREERGLAEFDVPEIQRIDLSSTLLSVYLWDSSDPDHFAWFEKPSESALAGARRHLAMLGALATPPERGLSALGRTLAQLPVHPRLARMLIAAGPLGLWGHASLLAALISEKDILTSQQAGAVAKVSAESDVLRRMEIFEQIHGDGLTGHGPWTGVDMAAVAHVERVREDILRMGQSLIWKDASDRPQTDIVGANRGQSLLKLLLAAYPDRVCRRRSDDHQRALMVGGGGVRLAVGSSVQHPEFFLAIDIQNDPRSSRGEAVVVWASGIDSAWLMEMFPQAVKQTQTVEWDSTEQRVVALRRWVYHDLILRENQTGAPDPVVAAGLLAEKAQPHLREIMTADGGARGLLARLAFLRQAMPELQVPQMTPELIAHILIPACAARRSMAELRAQNWRDLIWNALSYPVRRALDLHAPQTITLPSGRVATLDYTAEGLPTLSVRVQEMFGCAQTPRIASGRVAVQLQLLGPNYRPVQITSDLASFWKQGYFLVRKDLRARYPKHAWPEDPATARPPMAGRGRVTR